MIFNDKTHLTSWTITSIIEGSKAITVEPHLILISIKNANGNGHRIPKYLAGLIKQMQLSIRWIFLTLEWEIDTQFSTDMA